MSLACYAIWKLNVIFRFFVSDPLCHVFVHETKDCWRCLLQARVRGPATPAMVEDSDSTKKNRKVGKLAVRRGSCFYTRLPCQVSMSFGVSLWVASEILTRAHHALLLAFKVGRAAFRNTNLE